MPKRNYSQYTDKEILVFSQQGDNRATDYLLEKYKALVLKKARTLYLIGGENDDLIQEGMIALYKAICNYDPQRQESFSGFAALCIERQLYNVIKGANRLKNSPLNSYISLYAPTENIGNTSTSQQTLADTLLPTELMNPEDILIDQENVSSLENLIEKTLSPFEGEVVQLYIEGRNYQQIAKILGKSAKSVDNALQRAKKKLEKAVNGER